MAENSAIEWTDHTFNPWIGCTAVSPACDHCYAEAMMDHRYGRVQWGPHGERVRTAPANWGKPHAWQRRAAEFFDAHGRRQRVFCASLADVFDNQAPAGARDDLWQLIRETTDLDWLLLTKRPQNIAKMLPAFWDEIRGHVWLGTSTENQKEANRRLPALLAITPRPAVFFASAEPLLGPIDFTNVQPSGRYEVDVLRGFDFDQGSSGERLGWIIVGGESGADARPMHPAWARSIRDQCVQASVPFLFKQWGVWTPICEMSEEQLGRCYRSNRRAKEGENQEALDEVYGRTRIVPSHVLHADGSQHDNIAPRALLQGTGAMTMFEVGKKAAGRLLDGVLHDGAPKRITG